MKLVFKFIALGLLVFNTTTNILAAGYGAWPDYEGRKGSIEQKIGLEKWLQVDELTENQRSRIKLKAKNLLKDLLIDINEMENSSVRIYNNWTWAQAELSADLSARLVRIINSAKLKMFDMPDPTTGHQFLGYTAIFSDKDQEKKLAIAIFKDSFAIFYIEPNDNYAYVVGIAFVFYYEAPDIKEFAETMQAYCESACSGGGGLLDNL